MFHVQHFKVVIRAIHTMAKYDCKLNTFQSPGTAVSLVTLVNKIGKFLVGAYIELDEEDKEKAVSRFLIVFQMNVKMKVNKLAIVTRVKNRRGKKEDIPTTEDVKKLAEYLDREREACYLELSKEFSDKKWLYLLELTSMSILVFNRKRVGDTQNIEISDFLNREIFAENTDDELSNEAIKSRLQIRGKLYRTVPVLITKFAVLFYW